MNLRASLAALITALPLLFGATITYAAGATRTVASQTSARTATPSSTCESIRACPTNTPSQLPTVVNVNASGNVTSPAGTGSTRTANPSKPPPPVTCGVSCPTFRFVPTCAQVSPLGPLAQCVQYPTGCPPPATLYDVKVTRWFTNQIDQTIALICRVIPPTDPTSYGISVALSTSPDVVDATINPFGNVLPLTLPVYLQIRNPVTYQTFTASNGNLQCVVTLRDPHYVWYFDDGVTLTPTTDPGGPYPTGKVQYKFKKPGHHFVNLQVIWTADWIVTDPEIPGLNQQGSQLIEQRTRPQFPLNVVEAHAVLVS